MNMATGYDPEMLPNDPALERVGITTERLPDGQWSATMSVTEADLNRHGVGHGGVVFLLADAVFERVTNADLDADRVAFAASASIDFVRPALPGDTLGQRVAGERWAHKVDAR